MTEAEHFNLLMDKWICDDISETEMQQLSVMIRQPEHEAALHQYLELSFHWARSEKASPEWTEQFIGQVNARIRQQEPQPIIQEPLPVIQELQPLRRSKLLYFTRWAAAAVLLFVLAGGGYLALHKQHTGPLSQQERFKNDVAPGGNKAILQLADGSTISLDAASNTNLAVQGGATVAQKDGALIYSKGGSVVYNDVSTPVSGQYQISLPDGTRVWLDALSSIHFPTSFPGNYRDVEVSGQVYFEVTSNPSQPFRVKVKDQVIEVLGTGFNVNAYDKEHSIKTTLAEGAVKVISHNNTLLLRPGQQAQKGQNGDLKLVADPDMDEVLGWKNGLFRYNGASIATIMDQAARWYGVNIQYQDTIGAEFVAKIPRQVPISQLLSLLEATREVHFQIEGKTIIVMK
jgi:ferric-dicitrate binding protein FerR (iron transport regulator)